MTEYQCDSLVRPRPFTLTLTRGINFRERAPLKQPFLGFPMQVGGWRGSRENLEQVYLDSLKLSDN